MRPACATNFSTGIAARRRIRRRWPRRWRPSRWAAASANRPGCGSRPRPAPWRRADPRARRRRPPPSAGRARTGSRDWIARASISAFSAMVSGSTSTPTSRSSRRQRVQVLAPLHHELGHEAVEVLDAVLAVVAGFAEVLARRRGTGRRKHGGRAGGRSPTTRSPGAQAGHVRRGLHHLAQRFVAQHEIVASPAATCRTQTRRFPYRCRKRPPRACAA